MYLVVDIENSVTVRASEELDMSPYNKGNQLVSCGWAFIDSDLQIQPINYAFFNHAEGGDGQAARDNLQAALNAATTLIGHHLKHDLQWLYECGFTYEGDVYDTMIGEYVVARGIKAGFSLEESCIRRKVALKKSDLIDTYYQQGVTFYDIPKDIVEEYGRGDIQSTAELFVVQQSIYAQSDNLGLVPTRNLMNELLLVLTEMERNGVKIDEDALNQVEAQFYAEQQALKLRLEEIVHEVMGDTPINLASPEQLSQVIYSRKVKSKPDWVKKFNIGTNERGKPLRRPNMAAAEFAATVRDMTVKLHKTKAQQCPECHGKGMVFKTKKNGDPYAKPSICPTCNRAGVVYIDLPAYAGLKLSPESVHDCAQGGFSTSSDALEALYLQTTNETAKEFLKAIIRLNAVDTYLQSFVNGIKKRMQEDGVLHAHFNQCVTSTGRLSSSGPNLQNFPRANTFPIRKAFVSRFENGVITEVDFSGLEFRVAGELSGDAQVLEDVLVGKDVHRQTASIIKQCDPKDISKDERQDAKEHTFAPLYGATGARLPPHMAAYYSQFFVIYEGIGEWHQRLAEEVIRTKKLRIPSGREYAWPTAKRSWNGSVTFATQVKNYPVQGFATADIVPCALIAVHKRMKAMKLKSLLVLTIHDSIGVDTHPDEKEIVAKLLVETCMAVKDEVKRRYNYDFTVPLAVECKQGTNLLNAKELDLTTVRMAA